MRWIGTIVVGACLLLASKTFAQSAADKAAARDLAIAGIKLHNQGEHKKALEKLQRAQRLFDAPTHLLFIARSQVKLGLLVEGSETYRELNRSQLGSDPPAAFVNAVNAGKKELPAVLPRIPKLTVEVEPSDVEGLEVFLDNQPISSAAIGVARPTNPGKHVVRVTAPGYKRQQKELKLDEGKTTSLKFTLEKGSGEASTSASQSDQPNDSEDGSSEGGQKERSNVGFFAGARLLLSVPAGTLVKKGAPGTREFVASDVVGPGGGLELRGGIRLFQYFGVQVFVGAQSLASNGTVGLPDAAKTTGTTTMTQLGLGVVGGTPRGKFGGFGEVDLVARHSYSAPYEIPANASLPGCEGEFTADGAGVRLAGGLRIPLGRSWQLSPFAGANLVSLSEVSFDGCPPNLETLTIDDERRGVHSVFTLGVGIDWLLGKD